MEDEKCAFNALTSAFSWNHPLSGDETNRGWRLLLPPPPLLTPPRFPPPNNDTFTVFRTLQAKFSFHSIDALNAASKENIERKVFPVYLLILLIKVNLTSNKRMRILYFTKMEIVRF